MPRHQGSKETAEKLAIGRERRTSGPKEACENSRKGKKQQVPYATLCRKNISRNGPRNCRSLGSARDDKGEGGASMKSGGRTERVFYHLGSAVRS